MTPRSLVVSLTLLAGAAAALACSKEPSASAATPAASIAVKPSATLVTADANGFTPSSITVAKGKPATLTFYRTTDETCATAVVFPDLGIKKELPLKQPVDVELPTGDARKLAFQCGMGMYKSAVVVQ